MFNKYLTLAAVVVCTANAVNGYTYEVIDCMKPSRVNEYQLNSICPKVEVQQSVVEEEMMLLQVESEQVTKGYRCSVTSSTFWLYCGAFSHTKLAKVPSIGDTEELIWTIIRWRYMLRRSQTIMFGKRLFMLQN